VADAGPGFVAALAGLHIAGERRLIFLDELEHVRPLARIGQVPQEQAERIFDAGAVVFQATVGQQVAGRLFRLLEDDRVVHHVERLGSDRRDVALAGDQFCVGHVEEAQKLGHHAADDGQIGAAVSDFLQQGIGLSAAADLAFDLLRGRAVRALQIEAAGHRQDAVANRFGIEPPAVHAPDERVVGIDGIVRLAVIARKLIGPAEHDAANQTLDRPAVIHELHGQVIEQRLVRWHFAQRAEIIDGRHDAAPEEVVPDAVGQDAGRQRVVATGHPGGELHAAALRGIDLGRLREREHFQEAAGSHVAEVGDFAADIDAAVAGTGRIAHGHDRLGTAGPRLAFQGADFVVQFGYALLAFFQLLLNTRRQRFEGRFALGLSLGGGVFAFAVFAFPQCHASTLAWTGEKLVAAWFGGTREKHPDVGIWFSRHDASGWTAPVEVANGVEDETTRYPCWNPVLFQMPSGPLLLFYKVGPSPSRWWGMLIRSSDSGQTWSPPVKLPGDIPGPIKNKPILLEGGRLLSGSSTEDRGWRVHMEWTTDAGKTWERTDVLCDGVSQGAIQPTILKHGERLQILSRNRVPGPLWESWSDDGGRTWTKFELTSLPHPGSGIDGVTLADGRQLLVYNHTVKGRSPINIAISADGKIWQAAAALETSPGEYSYPAVIQTPDGLVHVTYTWRRQRVKHVTLDPAKLELKPIVDSQWPQ